MIEDEVKLIQELPREQVQLGFVLGDFSLARDKVYCNGVESKVDDFIVQNGVLLS